jgi:(p)ppGpp synthase/HD superfamily hydrolase
MTLLTERFTRAVDYARVAHAAHYRKGSRIPYIYHLLGVSSLVIEFGGNEDQAIAGLLHDVIEDWGAHHGPAIEAQWGANVARIVLACTDGTAEDKAMHVDAEAKRQDWRRRKAEYLHHLASADDEVLLVSACDKLHNARAIVQDLEDSAVGTQVFERFTGGQDGTLWYYRRLDELFSERRAPASAALATVVRNMGSFVAKP